MQISQITMRGFMSHADTTIDLPRTGVVLVTGPNGAGKSSLIEAVSFGGWGETLRGKPPWSAKDGEVRLETHSGFVVQRYAGKKIRLSFYDATHEPIRYETTSKAQAELEHLLGEHEVWKRAVVFSSADVHAFSLAKDSQRKELIETILRLDRFEPAYRAALKDKGAAERQLFEATYRVRAATARAQAALKRLEGWDEKVAALGKKPTNPDKELLRVKLEIAALQGPLEALQEEAAEETTRLIEIKKEHQIFQDQLDALPEDECPVCQQQVAKTHHKSITTELRQKLRQIYSAMESQSRKTQTARFQASKLSEKIKKYNHELQVIQGEQIDFHRWTTRQRELIEERDKAEQELEDAEDETDRANADLHALQDEVAELEQTTKVLSLTGVRAHLLHNALGAIEQLANNWLDRLTALGDMPLRLRLTPYSEKVSGGLKDAIGLEVEGAGQGHGYRASSGGERRRIDVVLLLALAQVAEASRNTTDSTLFFDECFDALDETGRMAVAHELQHLAQERCVVVITHDDQLARALRPRLHLRVVDGKVTVR